MKKIVLMPVKNEDWILEYSLSCASLWADHIIIADQGSTDNSREIYKKFGKVIVIENPFEFHSGSVRKLLLEEARKIPGNNLLFSLDADEILSSNFLDTIEQKTLLDSLAPWDSLILQWINLWWSPTWYRNDDSVWSNSWKHFAFYDNREYSYEFIDKINDHEARVPADSIIHSITNIQIKVLHFQFLWRERMLSKQRRYRVHDLIQQPNSLINNIKLNLKYFPTKIEEKAGISEVPSKWIEIYRESWTSSDQIQFYTDFYWYDRDILEKLTKFGTKYFQYLDIWDDDWNKKAKIIWVDGDFSDPRNVGTKIYHMLQCYIIKIIAYIPQFIKAKL